MTERAHLSRRKFLTMLLAAVPTAAMAQGMTMAPERLKVNRISLDIPGPPLRFVHFTDLHYRGESALTRKLLSEVRRLEPEFACFTGDLIDSADAAPGAFAFVRSLGCPVYAVPGNHDRISGVPYADFSRAFASTGGGWLENSAVTIAERELELVGLGIDGDHTLPPPEGKTRILLTHFPQLVEQVGDDRFTLILAGHSHGGQVRLPFMGPLYLPPGVGRYDLGMYTTPAGPLHVNPGIGTSALPLRFCCPPELSLFTS